MKKPDFILITIVIVLASGGHRTPAQETNKQDSKNPSIASQSEDLQEANRLEGRASESFAKRDFKQAEKFLKMSLALKEKVLGSDHTEVATTLHNLAIVYEGLRKFDEAKPLYLRSALIRESKLGPSHPDSIEALKDYACSLILSDTRGKPDQDRLRLMRRASCMFLGLADDCQYDGILNGKAISLPLAPYPQAAKISQRVYVYVHVSEDGQVVSANAPCADRLLAKAAEEAALHAKFKPVLVSGKAVQVNGILIYDFIHR